MSDFKFVKETKIIEVGIADIEITVQQLYDACRDFEDENYNMEMFKVVDGSGKEELGPGVRVGITIKLIDWKLKFADRPPPTWVVCDVSGGNLVCYDTAQQKYVNPIEPAAYVTVTKTSSSSATLQDLEAIQYASFQGGVHIDVAHGQPGTAYPMGTEEYPVNNLADAKLIAIERGFHLFHICEGDLTLGAGDNVDGYTFRGTYRIRTIVTVEAGCSTVKTVFEYLGLEGTLSGKVVLYRVGIGNLVGFSGVANTCVLAGNITLAGSGNVNFLHCYTALIHPNCPEIDMGGSGRGLAARAHSGGLHLKNKTGSENVSIDFVSGCLEIASSVTAGTIIVRGVGKVIDNGSATVDKTGLVVGETVEAIASDVLDILSDTDFIKDIEGGKWEISGDEMIFYKDDNITEIARFTIARDANNNPIMRTRQ